MKALNDTDAMPFRKHQGVPMQDVLCKYLHYLWTNGMSKDDRPVASYIRKNLAALQQEDPDLIWE